MAKWNLDAYIASLPDMPLDELCARLRGVYPDGVKYGVNPLQAEAARRLEEFASVVEGLVEIVAATREANV